MKLNRQELCLLQQSLGLREMTIINTQSLNRRQSRDETRHLRDTTLLRRKVIGQIREIDKGSKNKYEIE